MFKRKYQQLAGDVNRDWRNVDWVLQASNFTGTIVVDATVNSQLVRTYEFSASDIKSSQISRLMNDMLTALKQHRTVDSTIPADVIDLVTFMQATFTPMTPQQEEIMRQLNLAVGALRKMQERT